MDKRDGNAAYNRYVESLTADKETTAYEQAMQQAIGGAFDRVGVIERELIIQYGLQPNDYLIDVGCGSGRLAKPLAAYLQGNYLGFDIVPSLVAHAKKITNRPDWRFEIVDQIHIPEADNTADMVCFFSVLTHLRHEESFVYLQEAQRVLKPGGRIVFSFLEFQNPANWEVFDNDVRTLTEDKPLNQFLSVEAIKLWADRLQMTVVALNRTGRINMQRPFSPDEQAFNGLHYLGQSVCVLANQPLPLWRRKLNNGLFRLANRLQRFTL